MSPSEPARLDRAARAWRSVAGASAATLLAAASHGIAGGAVGWFAVVATTLLALPLCTLLSGRVGSLWRLGIAVAASQFIYHWLFSWIGVAGAAGSRLGAAAADPAPSHAVHLGPDAGIAGLLAASSSEPHADAAMWAGHATAAVLTVALLHRGERAFLALAHLVRRALPVARGAEPRVPRIARVAIPAPPAVPLAGRRHAVVTPHRGPPVLA